MRYLSKIDRHAITVLVFLGTVMFCFAGDVRESDVAVVNFQNVAGWPDFDAFCQSVPDLVFTRLASTGKLSLVERGELARVMEEMALASSDLVNAPTAARVGSIVGARYVFVGTIAAFEKTGMLREPQMVINTRLVHVESGRVTAGWSITTTRTEIRRDAVKLADRIIRELYPHSPFDAAWRSLLLPGWGQLANNRKSGLVFAALEIAAVGGAVYGQIWYRQVYDEYTASTKIDDIENLKPEVDKRRTWRNAAILSGAGVWVLNVLESVAGARIAARKHGRMAIERQDSPVGIHPYLFGDGCGVCVTVRIKSPDIIGSRSNPCVTDDR